MNTSAHVVPPPVSPVSATALMAHLNHLWDRVCDVQRAAIAAKDDPTRQRRLREIEARINVEIGACEEMIATVRAEFLTDIACQLAIASQLAEFVHDNFDDTANNSDSRRDCLAIVRLVESCALAAARIAGTTLTALTGRHYLHEGMTVWTEPGDLAEPAGLAVGAAS